jgi:hypothetical protein
LPLRTFTAPTLKRMVLALIRSKSTRRSRVGLRAEVSYQLVAPGPPAGCRNGGGARGAKKPGTPLARIWPAASWLIQPRAASPVSRSVQALAQPPSRGWLTNSQNSRSRATRVSRGLPAMMALLIAPIEMPAIQVGSTSASSRAS